MDSWLPGQGGKIKLWRPAGALAWPSIGPPPQVVGKDFFPRNLAKWGG